MVMYSCIFTYECVFYYVLGQRWPNKQVKSNQIKSLSRITKVMLLNALWNHGRYAVSGFYRAFAKGLDIPTIWEVTSKNAS